MNSDDDDDYQREREKLENDLKKEIKRLQKFREQIKIWQLNDVIKSQGLATTALANKLNENKRWIEDSMEVYKDVERASKLKTFSNQSIMMASLEQMRELDNEGDGQSEDEGWNSEEGLVDAEDILENDEEDDESDLAPESIEALEYLRQVLSQLSDQTKKLNSEFEKLSHKKLRKNNLSIIESKKEKIAKTKKTHSFHARKILKLIRFIKGNKIQDINLVQIIQTDLNKYLEHNGDADYQNDNTLYDDIFNLTGNRESYKEEQEEDSTSESPSPVSAHLTTQTKIKSQIIGHDSETRPVLAHGHLHHVDTSSSRSASLSPSTPISRYTHSSEPDSPGIVKVLKPASAPTKPVGGLKWLMAAAAGMTETRPLSVARSKSPEPIGTPSPIDSVASENDILSKKEIHPKVQSPVPVLKRTPKMPSPKAPVLSPSPEIFAGEPNSKLIDVLNNLLVSVSERTLFRDLNLVRVPPGIQDLVISFASKRSNDTSAFLAEPSASSQFHTRINKPHLPSFVQTISADAKLPVQFFRLQQYWNKIRGNNLFTQFVTEISNSSNQASAELGALGDELTLVLFFGYYYGLTPLENLIAENALFKLGWRPYKVNPVAPSNSEKGSRKVEIKGEYRHWFKQIKQLLQPSGTTEEYGDYQVFDPLAWELFNQLAFKFEQRHCQPTPSALFC